MKIFRVDVKTGYQNSMEGVGAFLSDRSWWHPEYKNRCGLSEFSLFGGVRSLGIVDR